MPLRGGGRERSVWLPRERENSFQKKEKGKDVKPGKERFVRATLEKEAGGRGKCDFCAKRKKKRLENMWGGRGARRGVSFCLREGELGEAAVGGKPFELEKRAVKRNSGRGEGKVLKKSSF